MSALCGARHIFGIECTRPPHTDENGEVKGLHVGTAAAYVRDDRILHTLVEWKEYAPPRAALPTDPEKDGAA